MSGPLDTFEGDLQRRLSAVPPAPAIAPGLAVTVWQGVERALPMLARCLPDVVILHTEPDPSDASAIGSIRAMVPGVRIWLQAPSNCLAGRTLSVDVAAARAARWARHSRDLGAEVLSFNAEGPSSPGGAGWTSDDPAGLAALADRARAVLAAAHGAAPDLVLALSSHDCPAWHRMPWGAWLGPSSPVLIHLPQHYPAHGQALVGRAEALGRLATATGQWQSLVARGTVRADLCPPAGAGWVCYTQAHGIETVAACALYDRAALAAAWTLPSTCDAPGLLALEADMRMRRRVGHAPGRIARFQASVGLVVDSVVGPRTLAACGATE